VRALGERVEGSVVRRVGDCATVHGTLTSHIRGGGDCA
jgi:hypothetical protein